MKKELVTLMTMRFVFMRLILPAAFVSLSISLLGSFFLLSSCSGTVSA